MYSKAKKVATVISPLPEIFAVFSTLVVDGVCE